MATAGESKSARIPIMYLCKSSRTVSRSSGARPFVLKIKCSKFFVSDWGMALLIGVPAMAGLQLGLVLKDRISSTALTYAFSVVLLAAAVRVAVG